MANNFYSIRREAHAHIDNGIKYLRQNPEQSFLLSEIALSFQKDFGFTKTMMLKVLQPFIDAKIIVVINNEIKLFKNDEHDQTKRE